MENEIKSGLPKISIPTEPISVETKEASIYANLFDMPVIVTTQNVNNEVYANDLFEEAIVYVSINKNKKLILFLFCAVVLIAISWKIYDKKNKYSQEIVPPIVSLNTAISPTPQIQNNSPTSNGVGVSSQYYSAINELIQTFQGKIGTKNIQLTLTNIDGLKVEGFNITGTNKRAVKGTFFYNAQSTSYHIVLNEPGDDKWDGKFDLILTFSGSKDNPNIQGTGTWKAFTANLKRNIQISSIQVNENTSDNDLGTHAILNKAETEKVILRIRADYNEIQSMNLKKNKIETTCGEVNYCLEGEDIRKIVVKNCLGDGCSTDEYYFKEDKLVFAFSFSESSPAGSTKITRTENRYYYTDDTPFMCKDGQIISS